VLLLLTVVVVGMRMEGRVFVVVDNVDVVVPFNNPPVEG
jgi:hypothetical protein